MEVMLQEYIEKLRPQLAAISKLGLQGYFQELGAQGHDVFWDVTALRNPNVQKCAACSDEGNMQVLDGHGQPMHLVRLPGSGVLLDLQGKSPFSDDVLKNVAVHMNEIGIDVFTSHDSCGAMNAVFRQWLSGPDAQNALRWLQEHGTSNEDAANPSFPAINTFSHTFAIEVTQKMSELAPERADIISSKHIRAEELQRPVQEMGGHICGMLVIDGKNRFKPHADMDARLFPPSLVISSKNESAENIIRGGTLLLQNVGLNPKVGLGAFFTDRPGEQFLIVPMSNDRNDLGHQCDMAEHIRDALPREMQRVTRIERLQYPG